MPSRIRKPSALIRALAVDNSIPIDQRAVELWLADVDNRLRWFIRPVLQGVFSLLLHIVWFLKRLPLPQFSAHTTLQRTICWFCRNFVSPEANELLLRHFATESNILNFLRDNAGGSAVEPVGLYPQTIGEMMTHSFVEHDRELFRVIRELGPLDHSAPQVAREALVWTHWRRPEECIREQTRRWSQVIDFETAHALFMCLFCLLLTAEEYRDAINGFNLDQSIAIRVGRIIGDASLVELAYNKYPFYLLGPGNLGQRFLMHGFFTEYLNARLEMLRL